MMTTLIKHEWLRTRNLLGVTTGLVALVVFLAAALTALGLPIVSSVTQVVGLIALLALVPALQIALTVEFWTSSYSRTGYFTHALPLRGSTIFLAKLSWAVLATLAGILATLILGGALWVGTSLPAGTDANPLAALQGLWATITAVASPGMIAAGIGVLLMMYLLWPVQYYFSASVGSETPLNRLGLGGPVVVFVGLYLAVQILMTVAMFAIPYAVAMDGGRLRFIPYSLLAEMTSPGGAAEDIMPLGFLAPVLLIIAVCVWRSARSWNRKISLV